MTAKVILEDGKTGKRPIDADNAEPMVKAKESPGGHDTTDKEGKRDIDNDNAEPMPKSNIKPQGSDTTDKQGKRDNDADNAEPMPKLEVKNKKVGVIGEGVESPTKGTKKITSFGDHNHTAEVRYNHEYEEYQVHHYKAGKHQGEGPVSYHGNDKRDAHDTAKHTVSMNESSTDIPKLKETEIDDTVEAKIVFEQEDTTVTLSEDIKSLLESIELPEEFKTQALGLFEGAVAARIADIKKEMFALNEVAMNEYKASLATKVEESTDTYVSEAVAKWLEENQTSVKSNIRTQIAESFMANLVNLLESHYITIPEGKEDVLESALTKADELQLKLDEHVKEIAELKESTIKAQKSLVIESVVKSLTDTQADRVRTLAESVEFDSDKLYTIKMTAIVESITKSNVDKASDFLTEDAKGNIEIKEVQVLQISNIDPMVARLSADLKRLQK